jgi:hypothetical protein
VLTQRLGIEIDPALLELAFTHRSYAYETGATETNERLEFLGDSVLGLVVTAIDNFEPGFAARYEAIPLRFKPPSGFFPSLRCHAADSFTQEPKEYAFLPGTDL